MDFIHEEELNEVISEEVNIEEAEELLEKANEMIDLCREKGGIGLAAPQVGIFKRMFIWTRDKGRKYEIVFNPQIYRNNSSGKTNVIEGCLSIPDETYLVRRNKKIRAVYYQYAGGKFVKRVEEFRKPLSFVWQHEIDHLNGKTVKINGEYIDYEPRKEKDEEPKFSFKKPEKNSE